MIELERGEQITRLQSKLELRDTLEGCIDRLIRLSYSNSSPSESSVTLIQRTAKLREVRFKAVYSLSTYSDQDSALSLFFSEGEPEQVAPNTDSVEVFQEDSNSWRFVHRSQRLTDILNSGLEL